MHHWNVENHNSGAGVTKLALTPSFDSFHIIIIIVSLNVIIVYTICLFALSPASRRGQDKRGRHRSAAIPPNFHGSMCTRQKKYTPPPINVYTV